jgi:hypothetical protein
MPDSLNATHMELCPRCRPAGEAAERLRGKRLGAGERFLLAGAAVSREREDRPRGVRVVPGLPPSLRRSRSKLVAKGLLSQEKGGRVRGVSPLLSKAQVEELKYGDVAAYKQYEADVIAWDEQTRWAKNQKWVRWQVLFRTPLGDAVVRLYRPQLNGRDEHNRCERIRWDIAALQAAVVDACPDRPQAQG